jgi:hypothetical protein
LAKVSLEMATFFVRTTFVLFNFVLITFALIMFGFIYFVLTTSFAIRYCVLNGQSF